MNTFMFAQEADEWVARHYGQVVAHGSDRDFVIREMRRLYTSAPPGAPAGTPARTLFLNPQDDALFEELFPSL